MSKTQEGPGRPTKFTEKVVNTICEKIAEGIPLAEICRGEGMPDRTTVYDWINGESDESKAFSQRFARARDIGFDAIAEETLEIADDASNDWMERTGRDGEPSWEINGEHVQRSKLRIETRLKLLAKWSPKKYGDRIALDHSGITTVDFRDAE